MYYIAVEFLYVKQKSERIGLVRLLAVENIAGLCRINDLLVAFGVQIITIMHEHPVSDLFSEGSVPVALCGGIDKKR
jgi:hypothetical protein